MLNPVHPLLPSTTANPRLFWQDVNLDLSIAAEALGFLVSPVDASFPTSTWRSYVGSGTLFIFVPRHLASLFLLNWHFAASELAIGKVHLHCSTTHATAL